MDSLPISRTIDVGHFWLNGADPLDHLARWIGRTRVIHMHGIGERDHASLAYIPPRTARSRRGVAGAGTSAGVVTLEVFNEADLAGSLGALADSRWHGAAWKSGSDEQDS